eukprot:gene17851-biopygen49
MAEELAPKGSRPSGSKDLVSFNELESSSCGDTDSATERQRLATHQKKMRKFRVPQVPSSRRSKPVRLPPTSASDVVSRPLLPTSAAESTPRIATGENSRPSKSPSIATGAESPVIATGGRNRPYAVDQTGRPPRSYAAAATIALTEVMVGRSGNLRSNPPMGRDRPRSICVHATDGLIDCRAFIQKLANNDLKPTHLQKLPNGDLEVTFASIGDRDQFLSLEFVRRPRIPWKPGLQHPPPVWVRIFHVPAELLPEIVQKRMENFGRVLFARENIHPGTDIGNCAMTLKMVIKEAIPSYVHVGPYCLLVRHEAQPMTCRRCDSRDHFAANCTIKRCFNCGSNGHINADCPKASRCQGCGSTEHHVVQCDAAWTSEANRYIDSSSAASTDDEADSISIPETPTNTTMAYDLSLQEDGLTNNLKGKAAAAQESALSEDEEATAGSPNCPPAASEKSSSAQPSPSWCDQTERANADPVPEKTVVTHLRTLPDGSKGTENRLIAAPEELASLQDSTTQDDNGQMVKNWYDAPTPSPEESTETAFPHVSACFCSRRVVNSQNGSSYLPDGEDNVIKKAPRPVTLFGAPTV